MVANRMNFTLSPMTPFRHKMAASVHAFSKVFCRVLPSFSRQFRQYQSCLQKLPLKPSCPAPVLFVQSNQFFCSKASLQNDTAAKPEEVLSRYKDKPWDYLKSEEYIEKYGSQPVWTGYRRNHKGGIPPQKTRQTCIRGDKICGNPCPICRDPNIIVHHQNVMLLQQFICPHTGVVHDSTRTGVCIKQQKKLNKAIQTARDQGLIPFQIPHVNFSGEDYSNTHDAVGPTPPPPSLTSGETWYPWYGEITPDDNQVAKVKKTYKAYLKC
ncbi:28S ribosomal protein S18b, mitochondrial [Kryptolebias marmoratus]|uniref:Small ribosomal subunit protein mS40 n=1 Tax=Kryptolebias marmoratus TaxID=37003 RepID=A0A3Q3A187_KRYMA|nr:28S ribosomal protein S18b, mitochondrial [Kryptolebias marmoratus]